MMERSRNIIATPPGATIKEQLADRGLSQKEFAARMNLSEKHISKLINGEVQLTPDVAVRLEIVLNVPAKFWNNLESIYREKLIKAKAENEMDADIALSRKFPYYEISRIGWVPETKKLKERVLYLRKYFEVVQLELIHNSQITRIACRRQPETEKNDYALLAWAQRAKIEARDIQTAPINLKKLTAAIPKIRSMTTLEPSLFCPQLISILSECGVALVFLPHIGGSFLHGAAFYDGSKIVVGLTVEDKDADKFWFSLFHELAHILYGHIGQTNGTTEADEIAADIFARNTLIDPIEFDKFVNTEDFSKNSILIFADHIGIDSGIVVERLQKEGWIKSNQYNDLKKNYAITA